MTLENCIDEFIVEQQIRGNSEKTVKYYSTCLAFFSRYVGNADIEINKISLSTCKSYYLQLASRDITTTTIQTYIRALRSFLSWCYSEGYIIQNIPQKFKLPKAQRKTVDVLTDTEIQTLMNHFDRKTFVGLRNYCICSLMLDSGLRMNEVTVLKNSSIHIAEGYIIVDGKGNKQRIVPLGLHSKKALIRYTAALPKRDIQTPLFVKDDLTPIKNTTIKQLFRRLKKETGIYRLRAHLLRHTFATRYLENGGDIYSLQHILGHTSLEMVKKYIHLTTRKTIVNFTCYSPLDNVLNR